MPLNRRVTRKRVPRTTRQQPESPIVYECLKWLLDHGYFVWRNNCGACKVGQRWLRFGYKGSGDILGMTKTGQFLSVEIKTATGEMRPEQAAFLTKVNASGGKAIIARSVEDLLKEGL